MKKRIDIVAVKSAAGGNWGMIFDSLVPGFNPMLLEKAGRKHGPCPLCGGKDRFQFYKDGKHTGGSNCRHCGAKPDGFELVAQANGWNFIEAARSVDNLLNGGSETTSEQAEEIRREYRRRQKQQQAKQKRKDEFFRQNLKEVWAHSLNLLHPQAEPVRLYLENRGLSIEQYPKMVRFHPSLESFNEDGESEGFWPAMVSLVVDRNGDPVTIHRTFLTHEGFKAPVAEAKKLMPYPSERTASGGAIHLSGTGRDLHVTEGIETAFAVMEMMKGQGSFWATVNASMLRNLEVGEPVERIWVWSDLDRSGDGQSSAHTLVERVRNGGDRQGQVVMPPVAIPEGEKSIDWLDILNHWRESVANEKAKFIRRSISRAA